MLINQHRIGRLWRVARTPVKKTLIFNYVRGLRNIAGKLQHRLDDNASLLIIIISS